MNFSVLMSIYDKEDPKHFIQSIESILNQTLIPNEIIIVKDGILNNELNNVVIKYETEYQIVKTVQIIKNVGLGKALDIGLKHCNYEYVARMDSDDIALKTRFEYQIKFLKNNPDIDILGSHVLEFGEGAPERLRIVPLENFEILKCIRTRSPFNHPTVVYKKSKVILYGGYNKLKRKQDFDLFSRMINNGCKGANIDLPLLLFRSSVENYKRRKSFSYCFSYIVVSKKNLNRGYINLFDFTYVFLAQLLTFLLPMPLFKILSNRLLRKKIRTDDDLNEN